MTLENFRQRDQVADSNGNGGSLSRQAWDQAGNFDWNARGGTDTGSTQLPKVSFYDGAAGGGGGGGGGMSGGGMIGGAGGEMAASAQGGSSSWQNNESAWQNASSFLGGSSENAAGLLNPAADVASGLVNTASDGASGLLSPAAGTTDGQSSTNPPTEQQQIAAMVQEIQVIDQQLNTLVTELGGTSPASSTNTPAESLPSQTTPAEAAPVAVTPPEGTTATNPTSTQPAAATDATIAALQTTDPQAAQLLTAMEPATSGMTQAGFNQFESTFNQNVQGGQYQDVASAANAAAASLQSSGDATDAAIATPVISNVTANGDATLSTYTPPAASVPNPATITDATTPAPTGTTDATSTNAPTADTTTPTQTAPTASGTAAASATTDTTTPTSTATANATGTYYTKGDQIIGPNGQPFIMTGINDTEPTEHDELTGDMATLKAEGANSVRLAGTAADLEGGINDAFNQEVQSALNAGLFVDIADVSDESQYGGTGAIYSAADTAEAAQALQASAALWGNNPNVGWNVANEQGASGDANNPQLLANTETLLQAVNTGAQSVNPGADPLKFVDDSTWGQGAFSSNLSSDSFLDQNATALEAYGNVVGAVHDYESTPGQYNSTGINAIQAQGMPVVAEEVGVQDPSVAADSFNLLSQIQPTTGEPVGGLVWVDGTPPGGSFYNNVMTTSEAPAIENFWQNVDSEAASATPVTS